MEKKTDQENQMVKIWCKCVQFCRVHAISNLIKHLIFSPTCGFLGFMSSDFFFFSKFYFLALLQMNYSHQKGVKYQQLI